MSARMAFDTELANLQAELVKMGAMVEQSIGRSIAALKSGNRELAQMIIDGDHSVDDLEKSIESHCLGLLLRQQPVARDLRSISAALKIITDMERIGDHAADIAEISMHLSGEDITSLAEHLEEMSSSAMDMLHSSIDAYVRTDISLAKQTILQDDVVDALFIKVRSEIIQQIRTDGEKASAAIDVMMVAKYLERIGDHAVNICEWVSFYMTGEHKNTRIL